MKFTPREYQQIAIDWIKQHPRCALFIPMGLGKSASVLAAIDTFPVLIVAPLRVAQTTWPDEINKWQFPYSYSVIKGTPAERRVAVEKQADIYMINYENLPWLVELMGSKWKFKAVVADEMTKLKSFRLRQGGKQSQALGRVAFTGVKRFIGLTGTPTPRNMTDLWGQIWFLDKGERLGQTFTMFTDKYFTLGYDGYSLEIRDGAKDVIMSKISDLCLSIDPQKYFPTEKPITIDIPVVLPKQARVVYEEMVKEMYTEIAGEEIGRAHV
mgnify:FL=1